MRRTCTTRARAAVWQIKANRSRHKHLDGPSLDHAVKKHNPLCSTLSDPRSRERD